MAKSIPKINVALEDHQAEYQPTMIEFQGKKFNHTISILIDYGTRLSYISPRIVLLCHLQVNKFNTMWLVELATGAKGRVVAKV